VAHGIAAAAGTAVVGASAGLAASVQNWATFALTILTIISATVALFGVRRRRRRIRQATPKPPPLGASKHEWEIYAARLEQHLQDLQESSDR
jgi:hypothetical protein